MDGVPCSWGVFYTPCMKYILYSVSLLIDENDSSVLSRGRAPRGLEPLSSDAKGKACLLQAVPP